MGPGLDGFITSRRYLRADILFPRCELDCWLTIREQTGQYIEPGLQIFNFLKGLEIDNSHSGSQIPKITKEIECLFQSESSVGLFSSNYEEARLRTQRPVTTNTNTVCKITYMNILFYVEEMASTKLMYIR